MPGPGLSGLNNEKTAIVSLAVLSSLASLLASGASGPGPSVLYDRAKRAIATGNVVPERDLAPLVDVLRGPSSEEDLRTAIDRIETLADAGGPSPAAVKHYLLDQSTPLLLKVAADGPSAFARGDAAMALRNMGASRAVLQGRGTEQKQEQPLLRRRRGLCALPERGPRALRAAGCHR